MGRKIPEVQSSSMADIAFLLLIFFLVTTTIAADKGITVKLPPMPEDDQEIEVDLNDRNVLRILVNKYDDLLVEDEPMDIDELREFTKTFVGNNGADKTLSDSPEKAVVSLKNDRATSYASYITVQNELKAAYGELRDEEATNQFGVSFKYLEECCKKSGDKDGVCCTRRKKVRDVYPIKISEAEPKDN